MPDSTRAKILEDLKDALGLIKIADGYHNDIGDFDRGLRHFQNVPEDKFPAAFVAGANEARKNTTAKTFRSTMIATIVGYIHFPNADDTAGLERAVDDFIADLTKAIMTDPCRSGNSTFTEISAIQTDRGTWAPYAGVELSVTTEFRSEFLNP